MEMQSKGKVKNKKSKRPSRYKGLNLDLIDKTKFFSQDSESISEDEWVYII